MDREKLHRRYSVKKFDSSEKLTEEQLTLLMESFHLAPSSLNVQPWQLVVVESHDLKAAAAKAFMDTNPQRVEDCSQLLVLCRKKKVWGNHFSRIFDTTEMFRKLTPTIRTLIQVFTFFQGKSWVTNQVYLALGFILAVCADAEIDSLPMEGFSHKKLDRILGLRGYASVVTVAVGVAHEDDHTNPSRLKKSRLPFDEVVVRM